MKRFADSYRATFLERRRVDTDMGGSLDEWVPQFEEEAAVLHHLGGEAVMAARLAGRSPVTIRIPNSANARRVTNEWQVELRDRSGNSKVYELREDPRPMGMHLEMLVEG